MEHAHHSRTPASGFTLVEVMVAAALTGVVVLGVAALLAHFDAAKAVLNAKADAVTQTDQLRVRLTNYVRTRAVTRPDGGVVVDAACTVPGPPAPCIDIYRSGKSNGGGERVTEKIRIKTVCKRLTPEQAAAVARLKISPAALAEAAGPLCQVRCREGARPLVLVRHWADFEHAPQIKVDTFFPATDRPTESSAWAGGLCVEQGADDLQFVAGSVWGRGAGTWSFEVERRDFIVPLRVDESQIEILPP